MTDPNPYVLSKMALAFFFGQQKKMALAMFTKKKKPKKNGFG